jgi:predicted Zn-dependent protease
MESGPDLDKVLFHARTAARLTPDEANYWDTLAQICTLLGLEDEARHAREKQEACFREE